MSFAGVSSWKIGGRQGWRRTCGVPSQQSYDQILSAGDMLPRRSGSRRRRPRLRPPLMHSDAWARLSQRMSAARIMTPWACRGGDQSLIGLRQLRSSLLMRCVGGCGVVRRRLPELRAPLPVAGRQACGGPRTGPGRTKPWPFASASWRRMRWASRWSAARTSGGGCRCWSGLACRWWSWWTTWACDGGRPGTVWDTANTASASSWWARGRWGRRRSWWCACASGRAGSQSTWCGWREGARRRRGLLWVCGGGEWLQRQEPARVAPSQRPACLMLSPSLDASASETAASHSEAKWVNWQECTRHAAARSEGERRVLVWAELGWVVCLAPVCRRVPTNAPTSTASGWPDAA
jgi:hypothetical protein